MRRQDYRGTGGVRGSRGAGTVTRWRQKVEGDAGLAHIPKAAYNFALALSEQQPAR
jgi:hypothetical protein